MRHETFTMSRPRTVEELLFHWPQVVRLATNDWAKGFALSIARQSRRRNWKPTPRQICIMQRMVAELFQHRGDDFDLIEVGA